MAGELRFTDETQILISTHPIIEKTMSLMGHRIPTIRLAIDADTKRPIAVVPQNMSKIISEFNVLKLETIVTARGVRRAVSAGPIQETPVRPEITNAELTP